MVSSILRFLAVILVATSAWAAERQASGRPPQPCAVADDANYAYTKEQAVQVGGSPVYGAARQRRYLDALRGPEGQRVQYKRLGQDRAPDGTILDAYEVTYEGLEKTITLYLDWYHYNPPKAPQGFTCGQPFNLGAPPVNPFQESDDVVATAFEQGKSRDFAPILLTSPEGTTYGAIYDRFRFLALAARSTAASGMTLDPKAPPRELMGFGMVIVAHPRTCGDRTVNPTAIDVVAANGTRAPKEGPPVSATGALSKLVPGAAVPAGSLAVRLGLTKPRPNDSITITYAEACGDAGSEVAFRMKVTPARGVEMPKGTLPADAKSTEPVLLQALVDLDGNFQRASYVGGPVELVSAAIEATRRWRAEPARVNGTPVVQGTLLLVHFESPR